MHPGQLDVGVETATALVTEQFPQWRGRVIRPVRSDGTVNALLRLGDDLVLRFPLEPGDPEQKRAWLVAEADAARRLLGRLPVPSPEPVTLGEPGHGYPLPWAVYKWLPGTVVTDADVTGSQAFGRDLAALVAALRSMDTGGRAYAGDRRGGLLTTQDTYVATYLDDADGMIDTEALRRLWTRLRETPRHEADVWTHGDLMPGNLLADDDDRLAAVIDVGGLAPADPALDLMPAWNLFDPVARATFRDSVGSDRDEWDRGKGWAFAQAIGCLAYYRLTNPPMSQTARRTLGALLEDEPAGDPVRHHDPTQ